MPGLIFKIFTTSLFFTILAGAVSPYETQDENLKKWHREEVRYIITDQEKEAYAKLKSDEERREFVKEFWRRRDPTPATARNEFLEEYYKRIRNANVLFRGEGLKGWLTDRGRVYIMFGPPDEMYYDSGGGPIKEEHFLEDETRRFMQNNPNVYQPPGDPWETAVNWGSITWFYRDMKDDRLGSNVKLIFANRQGRYILSRDLEVTPESTIFNARLTHAPRQASFLGQETLDDIKTVDTSVETQVLTEIIMHNKPKSDLRIAARPYYFPSKQNDYVPVCFQLNPSDIHFDHQKDLYLSSLRVFGSIVQGEAEEMKPFSDFSLPLEMSLTPEEYAAFKQAPPTTYWLRFFLPPGDYYLYLGVININNKKAGTIKEELRVPDFKEEGLQISSILIAKEFMSQKESPSQRDALQDILPLGPIAFKADLESTFSPEEQMEVFYFVTGYGVDPATNRPSFTIKYIIKQDDQTIRQLPDLTSSSPSISQPLPLKLLQLPPGEYTLEIKLIDNLTHQEATRSQRFIVK
ncbi:MAG: GWxTD domain-containing protein [Candidatus Aminicenantes bacterium]|nr:GWxTD domain-containing protein [Candidatus Aminicenantes bacterium]